MKKALTAAICILILLALPQSAGAEEYTEPDPQTADAYQLVEMVNQLRAGYGLYAYQTNSALMVSAQNHSNWAASAGYHSHVEPDGSRPRDRAAAAGYGGGATFYIHENIYWGGYATLQSAMDWWVNSPIHFEGLTSDRYIEIGAGVAYSDSGGYMTLLFALVEGSASPVSGGSAPEPVAVNPDTASYGPGIVQPDEVAVSTPGPDGAIIHDVQPNEALINIAEAYGIDLYYLLTLNGLSESSVIYPDEQLLVQLPNTPTPTVTLTPTATATLAPTFNPTATPWSLDETPAPIASDGTPESPAEPTEFTGKPTPTELEIRFGRRINEKLMRGIFITLGLAGLAMVGYGVFSVIKANSAIEE